MGVSPEVALKWARSPATLHSFSLWSSPLPFKILRAVVADLHRGMAVGGESVRRWVREETLNPQMCCGSYYTCISYFSASCSAVHFSFTGWWDKQKKRKLSTGSKWLPNGDKRSRTQVRHHQSGLISTGEKHMFPLDARLSPVHAFSGQSLVNCWGRFEPGI